MGTASSAEVEVDSREGSATDRPASCCACSARDSAVEALPDERTDKRERQISNVSPDDRTDKRKRQISNLSRRTAENQAESEEDPQRLTLDSMSSTDVAEPEDFARRITYNYGCNRLLKDHEYQEGVCSQSAHWEKNETWPEISPAMQRARRRTVSEKERMILNGETKECNDHVHKRWKGLCYDTSRDQEWHVDRTLGECVDGSVKCTGRDGFVWWATLVYLAFKLLICMLPMLLINCLSILPCWLYARAQPSPTDQVHRTCGFWMTYAVLMLLHLPSLLLGVAALLMDCIMYYMLGFFFTLFTNRWSKMIASHRAIDPYRGGPNLILYSADIFTCIMGQTLRHGCLGTAYNITVMYLVMPWLKYFWNCNPMIYDLQERYVQQISTSMKDLAELHSPLGDKKVDRGICDTARRIISRSKQFAHLRMNEDLWKFVPHYPYPPRHRRWAVGLQAGGEQAGLGKFTLLVHVTHAIAEVNGSTEQYVLSNSVHSPVYRVMLWYNNPFHFLTGFVEASISNGGDNQPDKYLGGEHPMWLVTGNSPFLSERTSWTGLGMIDQFFDDWLPMFVHECRRLAHLDKLMGDSENLMSVEEANRLAWKAADDLYQEADGKDGVSRPNQKIGRHKYVDSKGKQNDKLSAQANQSGSALMEAYLRLNQSVIRNDGETEEEAIRQEAIRRALSETEHVGAIHTHVAGQAASAEGQEQH